EHELPAELAFVEIDRAAAGDPPRDRYAVGAAIVDANLPRERLMPADQRRRRKAQEADGVRNRVGLARVDHRLVERDLPPPVADAGVDHAKAAFHGPTFARRSEAGAGSSGGRRGPAQTDSSRCRSAANRRTAGR